MRCSQKVLVNSPSVCIPWKSQGFQWKNENKFLMVFHALHFKWIKPYLLKNYSFQNKMFCWKVFAFIASEISIGKSEKKSFLFPAGHSELLSLEAFFPPQSKWGGSHRWQAEEALAWANLPKTVPDSGGQWSNWWGGELSLPAQCQEAMLEGRVLTQRQTLSPAAFLGVCGGGLAWWRGRAKEPRGGRRRLLGRLGIEEGGTAGQWVSVWGLVRRI